MAFGGGLRVAALATSAVLTASAACGQPSGDKANRPWLNAGQPADARAKAAVAAMSQDEKLRLIFGYAGLEIRGLPGRPDDVVSPELKAHVARRLIPGSAGFVAGVPRLGIPDQQQTDASMGVQNPQIPSTALPSSLATAASFDPAIPQAGGAMIASEARASGYNVFLAGGANLAREPRNGRNFEYTGEDPLLAGAMAGALVRGIQSQHMISTVKHFAVNDQETLRDSLDVTISAEAMRQSDLLAFEIALETGQPASVMCSYNLVNGRWACENDYLLNKVLKRDWGFKGYVMSDWGAAHSTAAANDGLDQQAGFFAPHFAPPAFKAALANGTVPQQRLDDMAARILWALFSTGAVDDPPKPVKIDYPAHADVAQRAAEASLVLLKNDGGLLPLKRARSVAIIGGHADKGVLSGGGSSAVTPVGGDPVNPKRTFGSPPFLPSSPLEALKHELPNAALAYDDGADLAAAAALSAKSDVAIVFVTQPMSEGVDKPLELPGGQDALVEAVAKANPHTVVVVESGGAVLMPWAERTPAILEAFYPGIRGGEAIARILTGKVNPSGHLPISFPASNGQLAHPQIAGAGSRMRTPGRVTYDEGAAIGYKWYDVKDLKPLFAFGHGLSYTSFEVSGLSPRLESGSLKVSVTLRNTGKLRGEGVAQVYIAPADWRAAGWEAPKRLGAFAKADLKPGETKTFELTVDPRLLATYRAAGNSWTIAGGDYRVLAGQASDQLPQTVPVTLPSKTWSAAHVER